MLLRKLIATETAARHLLELEKDHSKKLILNAVHKTLALVDLLHNH